MQINVGTPDRIVRIIVGILLLALPAMAPLSPVWAWVSGIVGVVLIVTGIVRFCPAYRILGIRTHRRG